MKTHKKTNRAQNRKSAKASPQQRPEDNGRRKFMGLARNGAIGLAVAGGVGFFFVQQVRSSIHEHDLSRIGNGTPTIVQIHDPQCPICMALQRETRSALGEFNEGSVDYVVANIRSTEGKEFADQHSVPHVTLMLFNAEGQLEGTLRGERRSRELELAFRQLLRQ